MKRSASSGGLVLVVDDQKNWRETLQELLAAKGHRVQTCDNMDKAWHLLTTEDFDVAVLDIRLLDERRYDIQGLRLLERIRRANLRTRVIVMTGYAPPGTGTHVHKIGAEVFTFKTPPRGLDINEFRGVVHDLVKQARAMNT